MSPYWGYNPKPKKVKEGMKLQSHKIGRKWWSDKWLSVLESAEWESRLNRGLNYAREGQVFDLKISPGLITAKVQGTRTKPYIIKIKLEVFTDDTWNKVLSVMSSRASYIAKLITGEMPLNIEEVFFSSGVKLFPEDTDEIKSECTCPDKTNICKHVAAVYFVFADEFNRTPFRIFQLRGRSKKEILDELGKKRQVKSSVNNENNEMEDKSTVVEVKDTVKLPPLSMCLDKYWEAGVSYNSVKVLLTSPRVEMAILKRLGTPAFCDNEKYFWSVMKKIYNTASEEAKLSAIPEKEET